MIKFLQDFPKKPGIGPSLLLTFSFFLLIFGINLFQIGFWPFTNLAEGMGYDGIWYYKPANVFWPKTDNYHLFRQLPSTFVYFIKKFIFQPYDYFNTAKAYQVFNLMCNGLALIFAHLIAKKLRFEFWEQALFLGFVFFNFHILKDEVYNPVMTDTLVHLLGLMLLYFYLVKNTLGYFVTTFCFLFTFPIGGFIAQAFYVLNRAKPVEGENLIPDRWFKNLFFGFAIFFLLATSAIVYGLKRITVLTFPDDINIYLFPLTIVITSFAIFKIMAWHQNLFQVSFLRIRSLRSVFSPIFYIFMIGFLVYLIAPKFNNMPAKGFTGNFTISPPLYMTLKPLIGLFDHIMFFGPVVLLYLFLLPKNLQKYQKDDSFLFVSFLFCFFMLKPEARHSLFLLPLISVAVVQSMPKNFFLAKKALPFLFFCLIFSKFWYPCHLAIFPPGYEIFTSKVNHAIFQKFPVQHYFMFQGPMISHANYFLWLLIILPMAWICFQLTKENSPSKTS